MIWIALARACMAFGLGLALLVQEDKTRPLLLNFMGMFWLVSGVLVLKAVLAHHQLRPLSVTAGVLGITAGLAVLLRAAIHAGSDALVVTLLGLVILLTGALHVLGEFEEETRERGWHPSMALGLAELLLGTILVASPLSSDGLVYWTASIWALCAGAVLLADALRLRARRAVTEQNKDQA